MELKTKIFAILAIFCVLCSVCTVCGAEHNEMMLNDNGSVLDASQDGHNGQIIPPDNTHDEARHAAGEDPYLDASQDGHNGTIIPPDIAHDEQAFANSTNSTDATNTTHAAGGEAQVPQNVTARNSVLPATGNPIVALMTIAGVLGGAAIVSRKK